MKTLAKEELVGIVSRMRQDRVVEVANAGARLRRGAGADFPLLSGDCRRRPVYPGLEGNMLPKIKLTGSLKYAVVR